MTGLDNLSAMPAIASVPQLSSSKKEHQFLPTSEAELFVTSYRLQQFCETNNVPNGCVMQLVRTLDKKFSEISDDEIYDYFRIIINPKDVTIFKNPNHSVREKNAIRAEFTQSYFLYKNDRGYWKAELLLKDGDELSKKAVETAFRKIGGDEEVGEVKLVELHIKGVKTIAWQQDTLAGVEDHSLICLPDGGQLMLVKDSEVEMYPISKERVVTPYNVYDVMGNTLEKK